MQQSIIWNTKNICYNKKIEIKESVAMALIKCSECGREISDRANCCPGCGAPVIVHKWRCSKCGNMISEEPCFYCSNEQTVVENNMNTTPEHNSQPINQSKKSNNVWNGIVGVLITISLTLTPFYNDWFSSYYVAKLPSINAASVKVDGYLHKSKSCCQKVANAFDAEVIRVKPNQSAGTNCYGQTIKYKDCFSYCPLCYD